MISIIISSFKEPKTIGRAISSVLDIDYSDFDQEIEIIQVSPDKETLAAGKKIARKLRLSSKNFIQIKDPQKGKPHALNLAFKNTRGEIIVLTDGDVYFSKNSLKKIVEAFNKKNIGGVTGRPVSLFPPRNTKWGFYSNLLADAAHYKRVATQKKSVFFPMSGYIMAVKKTAIEKLILPEDVLSDDAYISYYIANQRLKIAYVPEAIAFIKYPDNKDDYYKQKVRSLGGYSQLKKYNIIRKNKATRTLFDEMKYFWFPALYARNLRELFWAFQLYFIRLMTWIKIFYSQKIRKDSFKKTWSRIESTK